MHLFEEIWRDRASVSGWIFQFEYLQDDMNIWINKAAKEKKDFLQKGVELCLRIKYWTFLFI